MKLDKIKARGVSGLYRDTKSGVIYFRQFRLGREIKKSTKTKNIERAKIVADKLRAKLGQAPEQKQLKDTAWESWQAWIKYRQIMGKTRANTFVSINASGKYLRPYFEMMMADEITPQWWTLTYIPEVRALTKNPKRKFFNDFKWLRAFRNHLKKQGLITKVLALECPDPAVAAGRAYTDDEVESLLNFADAELRLKILMAVTMGMRKSEILKLEWNRVDLARGVIHLRADDTKTKKARSFGISRAALSMLKSREKASRFVFPSSVDGQAVTDFRRAWGSCKRFAKVTGRFHWLRHTFLTKAFKTPGANPALICFYAGLSLEVAQDVYLHFSDDDTRTVATLVTYDC